MDYRVEELLNVIGETAPEEMIEFFGKRLKFEEAKHSTVRYNAIPYDFSQCEAVLQKVPDQVVSAVRNWFDSDKVLFTYRGGRLIKVVFQNQQTMSWRNYISWSRLEHRKISSSLFMS